MKKDLSLGQTPRDEPGAQMGEAGYRVQALKECARFIALLRQTFGPEPDGARLHVRWFPHDCGAYVEVVCDYDTELPDAVDYAYRCEAEAPTTWGTSPAPSLLAALPDSVRYLVEQNVWALQSLSEILRQTEQFDRQHGGDGRYVEDFWRARGKEVTQSLALLEKFRQLAPPNNVDAEAVMTELGGIPPAITVIPNVG